MHLDDASTCVPAAVATRAVFSADSVAFTWADVVRAAGACGSWQALLASIRDGVAADSHADSRGAAPSEGELDAAMMKFRYARNLIAADDLVGWLAIWGVSLLDWEMFLRRALSRERFLDDVNALRKGGLADEVVVAASTWPESVCSGFIERASRQLSADVALATGSGLAIGGRAPADFQLIHATADALRSGAVSPEAIEREVASHRLEWTSLRAQRLELFDEDMAKEVAMCVRSDGSSLAEMARACGVAASEINVLMMDIDEELLSYTLASREGDLIGPLRLNNKWVLLAIEQKAAPTLHDPLVRQRARERIIHRAEERAISQCVKWHDAP